MGPISDPGSPALLLKAARFRLGASENPQRNQRAPTLLAARDHRKAGEFDPIVISHFF
jgi:hypothetical protein